MDKQTTDELRELCKQLAAKPEESKALTISKSIVDTLAAEFKPEAEELVKAFESDKHPATKGNYARYMGIVGPMKGMYRIGMAQAMLNAGAGPGLADALRLSRGGE